MGFEENSLRKKDSLEKIKIETPPTMNEWISVKDRLPETKVDSFGDTSDYVLAYRCHPVGCVDIEYYDKGLNRWNGDNQYDGHITHWQPLPEPPKE